MASVLSQRYNVIGKEEGQDIPPDRLPNLILSISWHSLEYYLDLLSTEDLNFQYQYISSLTLFNMNKYLYAIEKEGLERQWWRRRK